MKPIKEAVIDSYNKTLYTYVIMLKQFGARYSDKTLETAALDITGIYNGLAQTTEINDDTIANIENALHILSLGVLNLQITICNKKYYDILPICDALASFIKGVEHDIAEAQK